MKARDQSPRTFRLMAGLLALVWLTGGLAAIVAAVITLHWLPGVLGAAALGYGLLWVRAARLGRLLTIREAWMPGRGDKRSDT